MSGRSSLTNSLTAELETLIDRLYRALAEIEESLVIDETTSQGRTYTLDGAVQFTSEVQDTLDESVEYVTKSGDSE